MLGWLGLLLVAAATVAVDGSEKGLARQSGGSASAPCAKDCTVTYHQDLGFYCYPAGEWQCPFGGGDDDVGL
jgi:hypothetical protein